MLCSLVLACGMGGGHGGPIDTIIIVLVLACLIGPVLIGFLFVALAGGLAVTAKSAGSLTNRLAQGTLRGKPLALFGAAFAFSLIPVGVVIWFVMPAFNVDPCGEIRALLLVCGAIPGGALLVMFVHWLRHREELRVAVERNAAARDLPAATSADVWLQDLLVAVFSFGFGLFVLRQIPLFEHADLHRMMYGAAYLLAVGAFGLYVAVDVCRRSAWGRAPVLRACVFVMIFFLVPATLPVAFIAWSQWRKALKAK
jgi:hypothetical protein